MKEKLLALIKENTRNGHYRLNNAMDLGKQLGLSRNWISQHLNELFVSGNLMKINTRPVLFLDKETLVETYQIKQCPSILASLEELKELLHHYDRHDFQKLIGQEGSLREAVDKCKASIAYPPHGLPTLLYGPTGTGKSTIVDLMYEYGVNQHILAENANYVHVNCSEYANNPELITANLFGYKKGAFTGADFDNIGMIEAADKGILFLDEVHCLKPECQEKLLLFMDHGEYRKMGDHEHLYHSDALLLFATTQDPEKVLLKTLLRRIPIRIEIPCLQARGKKETARILQEALDREAKKMKREIMISNTAYTCLLHAEYKGNIGELFNVVQVTCMNALYYNKQKQPLEIHTLHLPQTIIAHHHIDQNNILFDSHRMLPLSVLKQNSIEQLPLIHLFQKLLKHLSDLQDNNILMSKFIEECTMRVEHYLHTIQFDGDNMQGTTGTFMIHTMGSIVEMISGKYGFAFRMNEIDSMSLLIKEYVSSGMEMDEFLENHDRECTHFVSITTNCFIKEYMVVKEIMEVLKKQLDIEIHPFIMACVTFIMHLYHGDQDISSHVGVILCHGYATACSMANTVNQMLGLYMFDAIDMPLATTTDDIVRKLNEFLKRRGNLHDLILLVDMGSLEEIYTGLTSISNINVAIGNNVNTKLALMVGEGLKNNQSIKKIFMNYNQYSETSFTIMERKAKEKVILCCCATGISTAEKLKSILEDSLSKSIPVKVLTYDYSTLMQNKLDDEFFDRYEVICIVGTLNPKIDHIKFIPVEELIMNNSFDILTTHFQNLINEEDMELFRKRILKNFSLSNIIENLTILNPAQLLEHVTDAIDRLQKEIDRIFSAPICFGLYIHVCCLIERLVTHDALVYEKTLEECDVRFQIFVGQIKKAFVKVEEYYKVNLPIEEIEYIDLYIRDIA